MTTTSEPWYRAGLRFACRQCGACCTGAPGYVWLRPGEGAAIAAHLKLAPAAFGAAHTRTVDGRESLVEKPGGDCVFFARGPVRCLVYPVRPVQCRTFPFWPDILRRREHWDRTADGCPGMGKGRLFGAAEVRALDEDDAADD